MLSLSTCWNSHRHTDGRALALEARELGFEWIEVSHGTKISLLPGLLEAVRAGEIKVTSIHNFCPPPVEVMIDAPDVIEVTASKEWERTRWLSLTRKSIEMAARFDCSRLVVHLGSVSMRSITARLEALAAAGSLYSRDYSDLKLKLVRLRARGSAAHLDRVRAALDEILPLCEEHGVSLGIETRSHYEQVPNQKELLFLLEHYKDCPWIGAWHDFGHVQRQANLALLDHEQFLREIAPRIIGCHIHDVQWPARDHRPPLSTGGVDLPRLLPLLPPGIPMVWEVSLSQKQDSVEAAMEAWRQRFGGLGHAPSVLL
jgi:sugar phosphate isomerase/epimerase